MAQNALTTTDNKNTGVDKTSVKAYIQSPIVQQRIKEMLGRRASQFTTSVLSLVGADPALASAEPNSLFVACLNAASMDLPINKNLGFAHIIPYANNKKGITEAQFQMGWKGFIQLAQRTGQYKRISATAVYDGQLVETDPLLGNTYDWRAKTSNDVIGYVAMFELLNGYRAELYMSLDEINAHATRYSKSFQKKYGPWMDNFDAMALKTVIKLLLARFGPMNTEVQKAIEIDQSVADDDGVHYLDNELDDVGADDDKKRAIIDANTNDDDASAKIDTQSTPDEPTDKPEPNAPKPKREYKFSNQKTKTKPTETPDETRENLKQAGLLTDDSNS
jgi:recombination protein RecT